MSERPKEFYERDIVPNVTTDSTTPTANSLTNSTQLSALSIASKILFNARISESDLRKRGASYDFYRSFVTIGSGELTKGSHEEVARITARLGGRKRQ